MIKVTSSDKLKRLETAVNRTQQLLLKMQDKTGFWVGELEADASVTAGYIPLIHFMTGRLDPTKKDNAINYIKSKQNFDGSWSTHYGGPGDLNVTIQVYFASKLGGVPASEPYLQRAREFILSQGGVMKANTITRIWLCLFGQFEYKGVPSIPPEVALIPNWFYFNIYEFASWSRETIMALMLILANKPVCTVPEYAKISELFVEPEAERRYVPAKWSRKFWRNFFIFADYTFKFMDHLPFKPLRNRAMEKIEKWVVDHQESDGSWGGIMLPWVYSLIALKSCGYGLEHPVLQKGMEGLSSFIIEDNRTLKMQPATSPVWDTAWSVISLLESGTPGNHPALAKAVDWMLKKEIRKYGDWKIKNPRTPAGCWSFEFFNAHYPDIDDTAVVARALLSYVSNRTGEELKLEAAKNGIRWVKEMQSGNGGWAAFDRDNNKQILVDVPFADFITPLDPTSADVTAHAIELLGKIDYNGPTLKRAIEYLKHTQETDGSWYGRWGVNYIYGTGLVLAGLKVTGENMDCDYVRKAVNWLELTQHTDGGWGETCETYAGPYLKGKGPSTPSQTAWALIGLLAAGRMESYSVNSGIDYLLQNQAEDGSWIEDSYTGTGFPGTFYLRYDLYRIYFPLLALAQHRNLMEAKNE